jgi:hypothetical protein
MYGNVGTGVVPGVLAFTGLNAGWLSLSAFVLIMAGIALVSIVPRHRLLVAKVNNLK